MTDATTSTAQDTAAIERDIRRTQDEMSRTVDRIGDQLTPRNLLNALLDKAEDNQIDARYLLDGARRNPLALGMIAGGAIWLISDSDAKLPKMQSRSRPADDHHDPFHRDYVSHMERIEWQPDEDELTYQRRRDIARANYFMVERGHDEDHQSFRQRLDEAAERFRDKRRGWADSTRRAGGSMREGGAGAASRARDAYASNPLIGGLLAAAVGAIAGTAIPLTRAEEEKLSGAGEMAREKVAEQKDQLVSAAREKKDELVERAEQSAAAPSGSTNASQTDEARPEHANDIAQTPRQLAAEESRQRQSWEGGDQPT
jgi:hypothetical protein